MVLAMDGFRCGARRMGIPMLMRATLSASGISVTADISSERGGDACNAQGAIISILRTIGEASLYAYSSDRERCFHAIVNGAWSWLLDCLFLRQVFTIRQGF